MFVSAVYMNKWNTEPEAQHYDFQTEDMEPKLSRYPPPPKNTTLHFFKQTRSRLLILYWNLSSSLRHNSLQKTIENHAMTLWEMLTIGHQCDLWVCATLRFVYKCTNSIGLHYIFVISPCFFLSKYIFFQSHTCSVYSQRVKPNHRQSLTFIYSMIAPFVSLI